MPLYEVVLEQNYLGQQCINRWNYVGTGTPAAVQPSFALLSALGFLSVSTTFATPTVAWAIQQLQNIGAVFVQATARAVYEDTDFYGNGFLANTKGAVGNLGSGATPLQAFGFRTNRVRQSIGRGFKRFVGVDSAFADTGGILTAAGISKVNALITAMSATVTFDDEGNTLTFTPCVVSKEKYTTESGRDAYKYYATEAAQATHLAQGITWESYPNVRSQVSRQYGRGA